jgi:hypothetical protein
LGAFADAGFDEAVLPAGAGFDGVDTRFFVGRFAGDEVLRADFAGFDFGLVVAIASSFASTTASCAATDTAPPIKAGR